VVAAWKTTHGAFNAILHYDLMPGSGIEAMVTLTVPKRGQVTFRKDALKHLGIQPGGKIRLDLLPAGRAGRDQRGHTSDARGFQAVEPAASPGGACNFLACPNCGILGHEHADPSRRRDGAAGAGV
jgi:hypothetical protein